MADITIEVHTSSCDGTRSDSVMSSPPDGGFPEEATIQLGVSLVKENASGPTATQLLGKEESFQSQQPIPSPLFMTITQHPFSPSFPQSHKSISLRSSSGPTCRICHEGDTFENLISPCECSGSLATIHKSCLEKWLSTSNSTHCEICKFRYNTIRCSRPVWHWFRSQGIRNRSHGFFGDLLCRLILAPLCLVSVYLCGVGASVYMQHGMWESTGLALLCCFLLLTFLMWCAVTARFHWKMISDWRRSHQVVRLLTIQHRQRRVDLAELNEVNNNANVAEENSSPTDVPVIEIQ